MTPIRKYTSNYVFTKIYLIPDALLHIEEVSLEVNGAGHIDKYRLDEKIALEHVHNCTLVRLGT